MVIVRVQVLSCQAAGQPFRSVLRDLNLTPNQASGYGQVDREWSAALEAALTATRRDDFKHGINAATWPDVTAKTAGSISGDKW